MKIFGLEIGRADTAEQTTFADASTDKKKRLRKQREIGDTGTSIFNGVINEDHNNELNGATAFVKYDKMRKSDGTVKGLITAMNLPIRRARWYVEPASEDDIDVEIAELVEDALMEHMSLSWDEFLRQALLMLPYGVMVFEKVYKLQTIDGKDRIVWKKFAPRMPRTITAWQTKEGDNGVQQQTRKGEIVSIPIEQLLIFVNEKEGDNWQGTSVLRAAVKHFEYKNGFYQIDAVAFERQGLGIPKAHLDNESPSDEDIERAEAVLKNMRAHHQQYIIEPHDMTIEFMDMKASTTRDPKESIQHHNREMVKAVLAHFLELGATDSGSRALSTDQSDLFLQSLEAVANSVAETIQKYAVKEMVDLNFDNVENYPKIKYAGITRTDAEKLATAFSTFVTAGAIIPTDTDEDFIRELLQLPERQTDRADREPVDEPIEDADIDEELDINDDDKNSQKKKINNNESVHKAVAKFAESVRNNEGNKAALDALRRLDARAHKSPHKVRIKSACAREIHDIDRAVFAEENDYTPANKDFRRPLTFAEKKVDFNSIDKNANKLEAKLERDGLKLIQGGIDQFMSKLSKAVNDNDISAIKQLTLSMSGQRQYERVLKQVFRESYEYGKHNSSREIGKKTPTTPTDASRQIDLASNTVAGRQFSQMTGDAKLALNEALEKGETNAAALAVVDKKLRDAAVKLVKDTSAITVSGYINKGRDRTFTTYGDDIHAKQRSELLDTRTCNYCISVDGRIVDKDDSFTRNTIFHSGCRGIWVSILKDEAELPKIEGLPDTLRDRMGDAVNDLIQPKKPITKKNTAARKRADKNESK